jgi:hypothetical protein
MTTAPAAPISKSAAERIRRAAIRRALRHAKKLLESLEYDLRSRPPAPETDAAFFSLASITGDLARALNPRQRRATPPPRIYPGHQPEKFGADL